MSEKRDRLVKTMTLLEGIQDHCEMVGAFSAEHMGRMRALAAEAVALKDQIRAESLGCTNCKFHPDTWAPPPWDGFCVRCASHFSKIYPSQDDLFTIYSIVHVERGQAPPDSKTIAVESGVLTKAG